MSDVVAELRALLAEAQIGGRITSPAVVAVVNTLPELLDRLDLLEEVAEAARSHECRWMSVRGLGEIKVCTICDPLARLDGEAPDA